MPSRHYAEAEAAAQALKAASHSAGLDLLTQLPNRALRIDQCLRLMASTKRRGRGLAMHFLEFNPFKPVNDSPGHAPGDEVLNTAAQRLSFAVREADTVSHRGDGDGLPRVRMGRPASGLQRGWQGCWADRSRRPANSNGEASRRFTQVT